MKNQKKGILFGFVLACALMFSVSAVSAKVATVTAALEYANIKICVDGQMITPKDANGNEVEPFIIDGTTYLPVRAIAGALSKEVAWDGETKTVYLGARPASGSGADGTRSNPLTASTGANVSYCDYSFYPTRQVKLKVLNTITGDAANYLATKTSSINQTPNGNQEWLFFEVEFNYVSSTKGEDDQFSPQSVLNEDAFFKPDGSSLGVGDDASFYDAAFASYSPRNDMYPGSTSKTMVGLLINKGYDKILLKVPNNSDSKNETNTWVLMNDSTANVISTVDGVKTAYNIDQGGTDHSNDPIQITLKNSLPESISSYSGKTRQATALITDFSYTVSSTSAKITFTGEKTYDVDGSGQSRAVKVGWKIYDSDGYVVDDGVASSTSIKVGEKFKNCDDTIRGLEPGKYTLEIMGVN